MKFEPGEKQTRSRYEQKSYVKSALTRDPERFSMLSDNYDEVEVSIRVDGPSHNGEYYVRIYDMANDRDVRFTAATTAGALRLASEWLGWDD